MDEDRQDIGLLRFLIYHFLFLIMATFTSFEELKIWQDARVLYQKIIGPTKRGELSKNFRLCSQIKEAAGSVMDNIAEGFKRDSRLEFINHLSY